MQFEKIKKKILKYKFRYNLVFKNNFPLKFKPPPFISFAFRKRHGQLDFLEFGEYESRNKSTIKLINLANHLCYKPDYPWLIVNTCDNYKGTSYRQVPMVSYSTTTNDYSMTCPDFTYDCWKETGLDDYDDTIKNLQIISQEPSMLNKLGWRGANTHKSRELLVNQFSNNSYDISFIVWDRTNPKKLVANNFLSLNDQVKKWRYLIDIEGYGYSARLKILLSSGRVTFIQDRDEKEWFFEYLKPWEHYVPVSRDLSNLETNMQIIKSNPTLENIILENVKEFTNKFLTRDAAIKRWETIINNHINKHS